MADVTTKYGIFIPFHGSKTPMNMQTSWTFTRLKKKKVRSRNFCSLTRGSSLTFYVYCLFLSSALPQPPRSDRREGRSAKERVEAGLVDSAVRCWSYEPKQQHWRWALRYSLLCCQQKIIIETRNKKEAAKRSQEVRAASAWPGRKNGKGITAQASVLWVCTTIGIQLQTN